MSELPRFWIDNWAVTPSLGLLEREESSLKLKPRIMQLLVYLASRPNEVVSSGDLIANVWKGRTVSDGAIYQAVNQLRRALGEDRNDARYIETIPKQGYRLIAPVCDVDPASVPTDAGLLLGSQRYYSVVATSATLVVAAGALIVYSHFRADPRSIGDGPRTDTTVATVVRSAATDETTTTPEALHFYRQAEFFMDDMPNDQATQLAVQFLERAVAADPQFAKAWAALATTHMVMYANVRRDRTESRRQKALDAIEKAVALSPRMPEGRDALGRYYYGIEEYDRAIDTYALALRDLPDSPGLLERIAAVYGKTGDVESAIAYRTRAAELAPHDIELLSFLADDHLTARQYDEAARRYREVLDIRPDLEGESLTADAWLPLARDGNADAVRATLDRRTADGTSRWTKQKERRLWLSWVARLYEGEFAAALAELQAFERDVFRNDIYFFPKDSLIGATYRLAGKSDLAERHYRRADAVIGEARDADPDDIRLLIAQAEVSAALGRRDQALAFANRAIAALPARIDQRHWQRYYLIMYVLAPFELTELAVNQLATYLAEFGDWSIEGLQPDPRLDPIRGDAGFQALVAEYSRDPAPAERPEEPVSRQ